jgi:hypothetical protein
VTAAYFVVRQHHPLNPQSRSLQDKPSTPPYSPGIPATWSPFQNSRRRADNLMSSAGRRRSECPATIHRLLVIYGGLLATFLSFEMDTEWSRRSEQVISLRIRVRRIGATLVAKLFSTSASFHNTNLALRSTGFNLYIQVTSGRICRCTIPTPYIQVAFGRMC